MATQAFLWGILSAVSLPLGALLGLLWRPGARTSSAFMAFGAGALLFALSIELLGHVPHFVDEHGAAALAVAIAGALAGGALFDVLNQLLNNRGAFLRNLSSARNHIARTKRARARRLLHRLSRIEALRGLPPEDMAALVALVRKERYRGGEVIFHAADRAEELHFIRSGTVEIVRRDGGDGDGGNGGGEDEVTAELGKNDAFGELGAFAAGERRFEARARGDVVLHTLEEDDIRRLRAERPRMHRALGELARIHDPDRSGGGVDAWAEAAEDRLDEENVQVSDHEIHQERVAAGGAAGAAMAIWLGIAIDAVPESIVIGTLAIGPEGMSLAFVAGVFLANLPEAMSSAVGMRKNGMGRRRIMMMWGSLCLLTGAGAWLGATVFPPEPDGVAFFVKLAIEALAAGAMLTMIAETMLPEAFEEGGSIVGMATLCGFLTALAVASI